MNCMCFATIIAINLDNNLVSLNMAVNINILGNTRIQSGTISYVNS